VDATHLHHDLVCEVQPRGTFMNIRWVRSNELLLTFFVIAVVLVGVLAALVAHQQDQATTDTDRQVSTQTAPAASAPPQLSTPSPAQTPSQSGISEPTSGQHDTAAVNVPSPGTPPHPTQTPSKADTSAQAPSQHHTVKNNTPAARSAPQPADTPSRSDALAPAPDRNPATAHIRTHQAAPHPAGGLPLP
jgi:hypothetical protein